MNRLRVPANYISAFDRVFAQLGVRMGAVNPDQLQRKLANLPR